MISKLITGWKHLKHIYTDWTRFSPTIIFAYNSQQHFPNKFPLLIISTFFRQHRYLLNTISELLLPTSENLQIHTWTRQTPHAILTCTHAHSQRRIKKIKCAVYICMYVWYVPYVNIQNALVLSYPYGRATCMSKCICEFYGQNACLIEIY